MNKVNPDDILKRRMVVDIGKYHNSFNYGYNKLVNSSKAEHNSIPN